MKIFELIDILNRSDILLNESMSLSELRRRIIKNEMRLDPNEEDWYRDENNRNELIDALSKIVGPDYDSMLNRELKTFNTSDYTEKGRIVKPESLNTALNLEILRVKNRIKNNNDPISSQYEKLNIKKDVEIYSVFTPQANIELSHKILKSNEEATWCIASPTGAARMWEEYEIWDAEYPCVFIVVKHGIVNGIHNPKYQIKCNPGLTEEFAKGEYNIFDFIDEVRNAEQSEETLNDTSLFEVTGINEQTLESAMRKLMNTDKAYSFSKKYGADFIAQINKLESDEQLPSNERIQLLIDACKRGMFRRVAYSAKDSEMPFFIDRLIEYKTLEPEIVDIYKRSCMNSTIGFDFKIFNKIFNFFIKNKNCSGKLLNYAYNLKYPGIDEIYAKIFNSILVNDPIYFVEAEPRNIKKEYLERYIKALPLETIRVSTFLDIADAHDDLSLNEVELITKKILENDIPLQALLRKLIRHHQNYIPSICRIALKIKKITEDDIEFLYLNYEVNQIRDTILELGLKLPEDLFSFDKINKKAYELLSKRNLEYSELVLCHALFKNIKDEYNIPELEDIIKSDPNGSSEESKLHAAIIKEYKKRNLDLNLIYRDYKILDNLAIDNPIRDRFSKLGNENDYYNKQLDGHAVTPYNLFRYNLYAVMGDRIY